MSKFQPNDLVRCINDDFGMTAPDRPKKWHEYRVGRVEKASDTDGGYITVGVGEGWWPWTHFELVERPKPDPNKHNFKPGDLVKCVGAYDEAKGLIAGHNYRVRLAEGDYVVLDGYYGSWKRERFELVEPAPEDPPKEENPMQLKILATDEDMTMGQMASLANSEGLDGFFKNNRVYIVATDVGQCDDAPEAERPPQGDEADIPAYQLSRAVKTAIKEGKRNKHGILAGFGLVAALIKNSKGVRDVLRVAPESGKGVDTDEVVEMLENAVD